MYLERLADDLENGVPGIQRAERVLEDHLDLAPQRAELALAHRQDVAPVEKNLPAGRGHELEDGFPNRGLAAPAFADQPDRRAGLDGETHIIDRFHIVDMPAEHTAGDGEPGTEIFDFEEGHGRFQGRDSSDFVLSKTNVWIVAEYLRSKSAAVAVVQLPTRKSMTFGGWPRSALIGR